MGIDGSGKTTVARSLQKSLTSAGVSSTYLWCGWRGFKSWLFKPFASQTKQVMTRRGSEENIESAHSKIPFFDWFTWLDYFVRVCPLLVASLLTNTIVLADRYVYDVILALHADGSKSYRLVVWLFKLFPRPTIIFYVKVPPELAFARKDDVPSLEFLRRSDDEKRKLLAQFPIDQVITLDGTRTVQELTEEAFTITTALLP